MKYSTVLMRRSISSYYDDNGNQFATGCNNILIDGKGWAYDLMGDGITMLHNTPWYMSDKVEIQMFKLHRILPLDRLNPKETIDRFFNLLILQ